MAADDDGADVVVHLGGDSALVLWSLLSRTLDAGNGRLWTTVVENDAELWALNDVLLGLESTLAVPFDANVNVSIERARVRLNSARGDWPG